MGASRGEPARVTRCAGFWVLVVVLFALVPSHLAHHLCYRLVVVFDWEELWLRLVFTVESLRRSDELQQEVLVALNERRLSSPETVLEALPGPAPPHTLWWSRHSMRSASTSDHVPHKLNADDLAWADVAISTCSEEVCPITPGVRRISWEFPDPKALPLEQVRLIRAEIEQQVHQLVRDLDHG